MFGIGMPEMILILAVALIVIGPKKLPDLAKSLGKAMGEFKKATSDLKDSMQIDTELKEVKTAFEDIAKDDPKGPATVAGEADEKLADEALSDEIPAPGQSTDDDSMDQLKAAFDRKNADVSNSTAGATSDGDGPAPDADAASETNKG